MSTFFFSLGIALTLSGAWIMNNWYSLGLVITFVGLACVLTGIGESA